MILSNVEAIASLSKLLLPSGTGRRGPSHGIGAAELQQNGMSMLTWPASPADLKDVTSVLTGLGADIGDKTKSRIGATLR